MEDLTEVIMTAKFHPSHCHMFAWTSSRGRIFIADTRERALCDHTGVVLGDQQASSPSHANNGHNNGNPALSSLFNEIISSASDIQFTPNDPHIISRDYMTLKLWDVRVEKAPILTFSVHDQIRDLLPDLYDSDNIFDKFQVALSSDGSKMATGSYNANTRIFDKNVHLSGGGSGGGGDEETNMASSLARLNLSSPSTTITPNGGIVSGFEGVQVLNPSLMTQQQPLPLARPLFSPSFLKKSVLQLDFHPTENVLATPVMNRLHLFSLDG